jgi:hypothetical protein
MIRGGMTVAAIGLLTAGCSSTLSASKDSRRGLAPQSSNMVELSNSIGVDKNAPVLLRLFKESSELELWRQNRNGMYVLATTISICRYSGALGPKKKQGDRQAPEGFYSIGPAQLNYSSREWLSFNTGYPNQYDRYYGRTGFALMIHGGCSSIGCFAINDAPMQELFTVVRDSLHNGQKLVQLQIFPFRMNAMNMARYSNNPNIEFWKELKAGYDAFEETKQEPVIIVDKGHYVVPRVVTANAK